MPDYPHLHQFSARRRRRACYFSHHFDSFCGGHLLFAMMMIAFITIKSSLVPLIEGLCAQIYFRFEISVVCVHIFCFSFSEEKIC